jgi:hypothetical protein
LDQLDKKGGSSELINHLADDAQKWGELRRHLQGQVRTAREFAEDHCRRYNGDIGLEDVRKAVEGFRDDVIGRIDHLDQTVRDLLQIVGTLSIFPDYLSELTFAREFAWVTIIEAHKSTSIASSMKRLSWITVRFAWLRHAVDRS